jgi:hypothetical protein
MDEKENASNSFNDKTVDSSNSIMSRSGTNISLGSTTHLNNSYGAVNKKKGGATAGKDTPLA